MGILLSILAYFLLAIFFPVGITYSLIRLWIKANFRLWWKRINSYFYVIAVSLDQLGNVIMAELFNDILINNYGHKFGNEDETISSAIGKNKLKGTLSLLGRILDSLLNIIELDHTINSIE